MHKNRNGKGFTLVELLVVVVIIGILAAIALPNFIAAQKKAKAAAVKGNMRTVQIASESYATDSGGAYAPNATASLLNYLPGGSNTLSGTAGTMAVNPVDGTNGKIAAGSTTTSAALATLRAATAAASGTAKGSQDYSEVDTGNSYAVTGSDADQIYISGVGGNTLVLSNQ